MIDQSQKNYHEPDRIWTIFQDVTDFESFVDKFVVAGQFHKDVPFDVVKSYGIAEHILAHSWYHYPAIDEALVKLLRTMELAVKLRCEQLGITLNIQDNKGNLRKKVLNTLINELNTFEPNKNIVPILHWLRENRNYLMHPERETLFGTVGLIQIRQCLIIFNTLFIPDKTFLDSKTELERITTQFKEFKDGLFVLEHDGFRYIVHQAEIIEVYSVNGNWYYLFVAHAIPNNFNELIENAYLPKPLIYTVKDIKITAGQINGIVLDYGKSFNLSQNQHPQNVQIYKNFIQYTEKMPKDQQVMFQMNKNSEIDTQKIKSRLKYWCV